MAKEDDHLTTADNRSFVHKGLNSCPLQIGTMHYPWTQMVKKGQRIITPQHFNIIGPHGITKEPNCFMACHVWGVGANQNNRGDVLQQGLDVLAIAMEARQPPGKVQHAKPH